jgi:serine/threonine protein kinase
MPLAAGQTLSSYEILGPLGAGAMGEVYHAKDTRLDREVAVKVLPEHFAGDDERLRRFEREAKSLANLNHPNVAQIHPSSIRGMVAAAEHPSAPRASMCPERLRPVLRPARSIPCEPRT